MMQFIEKIKQETHDQCANMVEQSVRDIGAAHDDHKADVLEAAATAPLSDTILARAAHFRDEEVENQKTSYSKIQTGYVHGSPLEMGNALDIGTALTRDTLNMKREIAIGTKANNALCNLERVIEQSIEAFFHEKCMKFADHNDEERGDYNRDTLMEALETFLDTHMTKRAPSLGGAGGGTSGPLVGPDGEALGLSGEVVTNIDSRFAALESMAGAKQRLNDKRFEHLRDHLTGQMGALQGGIVKQTESICNKRIEALIGGSKFLQDHRREFEVRLIEIQRQIQEEDDITKERIRQMTLAVDENTTNLREWVDTQAEILKGEVTKTCQTTLSPDVIEKIQERIRRELRMEIEKCEEDVSMCMKTVELENFKGDMMKRIDGQMTERFLNQSDELARDEGGIARLVDDVAQRCFEKAIMEADAQTRFQRLLLDMEAEQVKARERLHEDLTAELNISVIENTRNTS